MRISDWSSDVCSSDLAPGLAALHGVHGQDVADAAAEERKFARDVRAGHPFHLPDRGDPQLAVVGRVVVGQDPDEAPVFASAHVQATGSHGWAPGREVGEVSVPALRPLRSEEHPSELQSLMRISYAVFCLQKKKEEKKIKNQK